MRRVLDPRAGTVGPAQALVLGLTQGVTEFLPVSSSAHLTLVPWVFGWRLPAPGFLQTYAAALHGGTCLGAAVVLRADVRDVVAGLLSSVRSGRVRTPSQRRAWLLGASLLPAALLGHRRGRALAERAGQPWQVAGLVAGAGLLLQVADSAAPQRLAYDEVGPLAVAAMSLAQAAALLPGVSRTGATVTAARLCGVDREAAARFSALMSLPVTLGASVLSLARAEPMDLRAGWPAMAVGIPVSAAAGAVAAGWLPAWAAQRGYAVFAAYRVSVGAVAAGLIATGRRRATLG